MIRAPLTSSAMCLCLVVPLPLAGCGDSAEAGEARREIKEALDATGGLAVKSWQDLQRAAAPRIHEVEAELEKFRSDLAARGEDAKQMAADALYSIERELGEAADKLERARNEGGESAEAAWAEIRQHLDRAQKAIEKARGAA